MRDYQYELTYNDPEITTKILPSLHAIHAFIDKYNISHYVLWRVSKNGTRIELIDSK